MNVKSVVVWYKLKASSVISIETRVEDYKPAGESKQFMSTP